MIDLLSYFVVGLFSVSIMCTIILFLISIEYDKIFFNIIIFISVLLILTLIGYFVKGLFI